MINEDCALRSVWF